MSKNYVDDSDFEESAADEGYNALSNLEEFVNEPVEGDDDEQEYFEDNEDDEPEDEELDDEEVKKPTTKSKAAKKPLYSENFANMLPARERFIMSCVVRGESRFTAEARADLKFGETSQSVENHPKMQQALKELKARGVRVFAEEVNDIFAQMAVYGKSPMEAYRTATSLVTSREASTDSNISKLNEGNRRLLKQLQASQPWAKWTAGKLVKSMRESDML